MCLYVYLFGVLVVLLLSVCAFGIEVCMFLCARFFFSYIHNKFKSSALRIFIYSYSYILYSYSYVFFISFIFI